MSAWDWLGNLMVLPLFNSGGFNPLSIDGAQLWLDAADASTLWQDAAATTPAAANTDPVGRWDDKSGKGNNVTQATAGNRPYLAVAGFNGHNAVRFEAANADRLIKTSLTMPFTQFYVFAVMNFVTTTNSQRVISISAAAQNDYDGASGYTLYDVGGVSKPGVLTATGSGATNSSVAASDPSLVTSALANTSGVIRVNGVQTGSDTTFTALNATPSGIMLGAQLANGATYAGNPSDQHIAELLIYTSALTAANIDTIEAHLMAKWL